MAETTPRIPYEPIPVGAAIRLSREFAKDVVVIIALDLTHDKTQCTTFGVKADNKIVAARMGDFLMEKLGANLSERESFQDFRYVSEAKAKEMIDDLAKAVDWFLHIFQGDTGTGHTHWVQFPEYRDAYKALQAAGGPQKSLTLTDDDWENN